MHTWLLALIAIGAALLLFVAMFVFQELGWRLGRRRIAASQTAGADASSLMDSAVFGLLGLLIGFTFSGAAARFDHRRELVGNVVNTTGTAWQRIDLLPTQLQDSVRIPFRRYLDSLLASYSVSELPANVFAEPSAVAQAQAQTWTQAVKACVTKEGEPARILLLPALNEMFGAVEAERLARRIHPPPVIFAILGLTAVTATFLAGYAGASNERRGLVHRVGVAATLALAVYVIVELEYPRMGLVRVNSMDQALIELRTTMNSPIVGHVEQ